MDFFVYLYSEDIDSFTNKSLWIILWDMNNFMFCAAYRRSLLECEWILSHKNEIFKHSHFVNTIHNDIVVQWRKKESPETLRIFAGTTENKKKNNFIT